MPARHRDAFQVGRLLGTGTSATAGGRRGQRDSVPGLSDVRRLWYDPPSGLLHRAYAATAGPPLLTTDPQRVRTYFREVELIVPDAATMNAAVRCRQQLATRVKRLLRVAFAAEGSRLPSGSDVVVVARTEARALAEGEPPRTSHAESPHDRPAQLDPQVVAEERLQPPLPACTAGASRLSQRTLARGARTRSLRLPA